MHNIDRTLMEYNPEMEQFESEQFEWGEAEWPGETSEVFTEAELLELASELLEVRDEAELDQFLGGLIKKAGQALGKVVRSPIGQAIGGVLKGAAKQALPLAGAALGGWVGGPLGATLGSRLASMAGQKLGLELGELSQEDREFEGAKQFSRFAGEAVKNALSAAPGANPKTVAEKAAVKAAQALVPGLLRGPGVTTPTPTAAPAGRSSSGRWLRRGSKIVLFGA